MSQNSWLPLGVDDANFPHYSRVTETTIASHPITGEVYLAYCDFTQYFGKGTVKKFNKNTGLWENVGDFFSQHNSSRLSLKFNSQGILFIAYSDLTNNNKVSVKRLNTNLNLWEMVGNGTLSVGSVNNTNLVIAADDTPYISYNDIGLSNKITVKKFDGLNWVTVGVPGFTSTGAIHPSLAIGSDNTPYLGFVSIFGGEYKASVMKYNGNSWQFLGSPAFSGSGANNTRMFVNPVTNVPYIAYSDFLSGYKAKVQKFNGSEWENVGGPSVSESSAEKINFAITSAGIPVIVYQDLSAGRKATVKKFDGISWQIVGATGFSLNDIHSTDIAFGDNKIYVSFKDTMNWDKATVMKFDEGTWKCLGSTMGLSEEATIIQSPEQLNNLIIGSDGMPYIGYIEKSNDDYISVKRFNFTTNVWEFVGMPSFARANSQLSMARHNNTPYIFFNSYLSSKATVMKYNGSSWVYVGQPNFTSERIYDLSIAIGPDETPYVAYREDFTDKGRVMKFNGTSWEMLSDESSFIGRAYQLNIVVMDDGNPYVAYRGVLGYEGYSCNVVKFNGSQWEVVGESFANEFINNPSLAVGPDGFLYLAYVNYSGKVLVKKFNGTDWQVIGGENFSIGSAFNTSLGIKNDGQIYISYNDMDSEFAAVVMRYNGIEWVTVGNPNASSVPAYNLKMVLTPDGNNAIITYSSPCAYAKICDIICHTMAPIAENQTVCNVGEVSDLLAEGENLRWYDVETFGAPLPANLPVTTGIYYVSQMQNDCEGPRRMVEVNVENTSMPNGEQQQFLTEGAVIEDLSVLGTEIKWYNADGDVLQENMQLENGYVYYVTQTINGCESPKLAISVSLTLNTAKFMDSGFVYYPNPVDDKLFIESDGNLIAAEVYNIFGQKLIEKEWSVIKEGYIDTSLLSIGVYILNVHGETGETTFRIIKK